MSLREAKAINKSNALSPPTLNAALIALRKSGSDVNLVSFKVAASAGNAASIDVSSLIPLAASVTIYSSSSFKNKAILGFCSFLKTKTAAVLRALLGFFCKAIIGSICPIFDKASTPA